MRAYSQKAPEAPNHWVSVRKVWATSALVSQLTVAAAPPAMPLTCNPLGMSRQVSPASWIISTGHRTSSAAVGSVWQNPSELHMAAIVDAVTSNFPAQASKLLQFRNIALALSLRLSTCCSAAEQNMGGGEAQFLLMQ